jgi:hypothetical protein
MVDRKDFPQAYSTPVPDARVRLASSKDGVARAVRNAGSSGHRLSGASFRQDVWKGSETDTDNRPADVRFTQ